MPKEAHKSELDSEQDRDDPMPLSDAFSQAWLEWLEWLEQQEEGGRDDGQSVARTAEATQRIARRLWRNACAGTGEVASAQARATIYAFVALIDERLLFTPWKGRDAWQEKPLEARLYGTRNAGEQVPLAIHKVLRERAPSTRDLANVYLHCLALGFRGRLRGKGDEMSAGEESGAAIHERWRHALFAFVRQRDPSFQAAMEGLERPVFIPPKQRPPERPLPDGFRLGIVLLALLLLLLALGHVAWRDIQSKLEPALYSLALPDSRPGGAKA